MFIFKGVSNKIVSFLIVVFVLALLVFSGPASAVELGVENLPDSTNQGDEVEFQVYVDIETNERVPVKNLTLTIEGVTDCDFNPDGSIIEGCSNITIEKVSTSPYGYGYNWGYGYGYNGSEYKTKNATFGYGYGYSYTIEKELKYNVTWNTTGVSKGNYNIYLEATAEKGSQFFKFSSRDNIQVLNITTSTTTSTTSTISGGGGGGISGITTTANTSTTTSTTSTVIQEEETIEKINKGEERLIEFNKSEDLGIEGIEFTAKNRIKNASLKLRKMNISEDTCQGGFLIKPPGKVYRTLCLEKENITNNDVENITIKFKIPIKWLKEKNEYSGTVVRITGGDVEHENLYTSFVSLYRFSDNRWKKLPTEFIRKDSFFTYFESSSPGLSGFTISSRPGKKTTTTIQEEKKGEGFIDFLRRILEVFLSIF